MSEADILIFKRFRKGDKSAFEYIFKAYYQQLFLYAKNILYSEEEAEDNVKDFFLELWDKREKIEIESSLKAYLYKGIRNKCLNFLRDKKKEIYSIDGFGDNYLDVLYSPLRNTILEKIYSNELQASITRVIEDLPEQRKLIFKMSRFDNLSHKQIAEKLNITVNTVKVQIYRALNKIRETLPDSF